MCTLLEISLSTKVKLCMVKSPCQCFILLQYVQLMVLMFVGLKGNSLLPCCSHSPTLLTLYTDIFRALSCVNLCQSPKHRGGKCDEAL